jgi:hypothetical protein
MREDPWKEPGCVTWRRLGAYGNGNASGLLGASVKQSEANTVTCWWKPQRTKV